MKDIEFWSCYFNLGNVFWSYERGFGYVYFGEMGEVGDMKLKVVLIKCLEGVVNLGGVLIIVKNIVVKLWFKVVFCVGCCGVLYWDKIKLGDVIVFVKLIIYVEKKVMN